MVPVPSSRTVTESGPTAAEVKKYQRAIESTMRSLATLDKATAIDVLDLFEHTRRDVVAILADLGESPSRKMYEDALYRLDQAIEGFSEKYLGSLTEAQTRGFKIGTVKATAPLEAAGVTGIGRILGPDDVAVLGQFRADLVGSVSADIRQRIGREIASVSVGVSTPHDAITRIGRAIKGQGANHFASMWHRAQAIGVTEIGRAAEIATQRQLEVHSAALDGDLHKRWLNAHVANPRPSHLVAEARYAIGGPVGPIPVEATYTVAGYEALYPKAPNLPAKETVHCFPGDTLVTAVGIERVYRRRWAGRIVTVTSTAGRLTGTPNHPALTLRGWVGLGDLTESDHLIGYYGRVEGIGAGDPDPQQRPSRIDEIFGLAEQAGVRAGRPRGLPVDFHGDGSDSDIDVVTTGRFLEHRDQASASQLGSDLDLPTADILPGLLAGERLSGQLAVSAGGAPEGGVSSGCQTGTFLSGRAAHTEPVRGPVAPSFDPGGQKPAPDQSPTNPVPLGEGVFGLPGEVTLHQIISIDSDDFSGDVFNLQTTPGWYTANSLIVGNCHCSSIPVPPGWEVTDDSDM